MLCPKIQDFTIFGDTLVNEVTFLRYYFMPCTRGAFPLCANANYLKEFYFYPAYLDSQVIIENYENPFTSILKQQTIGLNLYQEKSYVMKLSKMEVIDSRWGFVPESKVTYSITHSRINSAHRDPTNLSCP